MSILKSIGRFFRNLWSAIVAGGSVIILVLTLIVAIMVKLVIDMFELAFAFTVTLAVLLFCGFLTLLEFVAGSFLPED
jgi:hypothetical protein